MPVPSSPQPLPVPPLRRQEAERRLRDAIVRGELAPGERLREDELASWLGISRTPVREALSRLASAGLVELDANRGARVAVLDPAGMLDLVQVSRELVLLAQRLAAQRATEEEIATLRRFHAARAAAVATGNRDAVERAAIAFHGTILVASRNLELQRVYPSVFDRLERIFRQAFPEWLGARGAEVDGELLAAIEARDPARVAAVSGRGWDVLEANVAALAGGAALAERGEQPASSPVGATA